MHRIDSSGAVAVLPAAAAVGSTVGYWSNGNPVSGQPATQLDQDWFNSVQEELVGIVLDAGLTPDKTNRAQVMQALRRLYAGNVKLVSASTVLTADDAGLVRVDASAGNVVLTLPAVNAANGRPLQFRIARVDGAAGNTVTVQPAGADNLTSFTLAPGERVTLSSDGMATWYQTGAGPFSRSLGATGWQKLPSGLIVQWGTGASVTGAGDVVTFPLAFPTAARAVVITEEHAIDEWSAGKPTLYGSSNLSKTNFLLSANKWNGSSWPAVPLIAYYWIAVGH
ncbi:MAG: hypothetical protein IRZ07_25735 [Microbispora sp.]|nr:hypothetical protein [Microbispora sp.]